MQENTPREVELNFSTNEERMEDLEAARAELSGELNALPDDLPEKGTETVAEEFVSNTDNVEPAPAPAPGPESAPEPVPAAPSAPEPEVLRSRQPVNRPAGTPPLENVHNSGGMSALEKSLAGKSYGTVLRMLREHHNLTFKDLEQVTKVQPHYWEALEKENLGALPPVVFVVGYIRKLGRYYKLSDETSNMLVEQLKENMKYSCPDEIISSLEVDRTGQEENERKLKRLLVALVGGVLLVIAAIVLIIALFNSCGKKPAPVKQVSPEVSANGEAVLPDGKNSFDPNTVYVLLEPPTLDLPRLPAGQ